MKRLFAFVLISTIFPLMYVIKYKAIAKCIKLNIICFQ